jgi:hypothetical protein
MSLNRFVRATLVAVTLVAGLVAAKVQAEPNYYVEPSVGVGAQMYPSPRPVPAWVGRTYYTYQGLYPHEHLYPHMRTYYRGKGPLGIVPVNKTHILYW